MNHSGATAPEREGTKGAWGDIFRNGLGLYSALVVAAVALVGLTFRLDRDAPNNLFRRTRCRSARRSGSRCGSSRFTA